MKTKLLNNPFQQFCQNKAFCKAKNKANEMKNKRIQEAFDKLNAALKSAEDAINELYIVLDSVCDDEPRIRGKSVLMEAAEKMGIDLSPTSWKKGGKIKCVNQINEEYIQNKDEIEQVINDNQPTIAEAMQQSTGNEDVPWFEVVDPNRSDLHDCAQALANMGKLGIDTGSDGAGTGGNRYLVDDDAYKPI